MPPLRRYLRITKHSVLEVRIYLDRPADAEAWLLKRGDPALPRVVEAIQPLVLPKLREENERGKGRGSARAEKKGVKDVVVQDDFEVSIFLTEPSSRHSVLTKEKIFKDKARIQSNSGKLTNWLTTGTSEQPVVIQEDAAEPIAIREEDDDDQVNLSDIPEAKPNNNQQRYSAHDRPGSDAQDTNACSDASESESEDLDLPVSGANGRRSTRNKGQDKDEEGGPRGDDQKKLGLRTSYEGFSIYGRILCLVVKRRGVRSAASAGGATSSQAMLENWVSTQAVADAHDDDEEAAEMH